jgi:tetraacyldisaccharide 4'-kinase
VYLAELGRRNRRFDRGEGVVRLDRPVISVGNISVGGVGKTPMVMTIVAWLLEAGVRPCIAMRGYRSKKSAAGESDEAMLYHERFGEVPVVAQADRLAGLRQLLAQERVVQDCIPGPQRVGQDCILAAGRFDSRSSTPSEAEGRQVTNLPQSFASEPDAPSDMPHPPRIDCVILDDGFQHRQIARDLDIVLLDASRDPFADRALPAGWLREPVSSLARADAIVLTHAEAAGSEAVSHISARVAEICGRAPIAVTRHQWQRLRVIQADGAERIERPAWLVGRRVVVGCAIGNPTAFVQAARHAVAEAIVTGRAPEHGNTDLSERGPVARPAASRGAVLGELVLRDHDPWGDRAVSRLLALARERQAEAIVVTAKDWTRLSRVERLRWPAAVVVAELATRFVRGEAELRGLALDLAAGRREDAATLARRPMGE